MKLEELAFHQTALGELVLRRRPEPLLGDKEVYEVKLGDEFLMSSLFVEAEVQLAKMGLTELNGELDVVVGGLGLGYTAAAVLENPNVRSLIVVDLFGEVIDWHRQGLVPMSEILTKDNRCELVQGDFFALCRTGLSDVDPKRLFDSILVDIDHSPKHHLDPVNAEFYTDDGLENLRKQLKPGGVFGLWSDDPVDESVVTHFERIFGKAAGHNIEFQNPYSGGTSLNSVYLARNFT